MNGAIIIALKALIVIALMVVGYFVWYAYQRQSWNQTLTNIQKRSGKVELLKVKYRSSYVMIIVFFFVFFFTLNSPIQMGNAINNVNPVNLFTTKESRIEEIVEAINPEEGDIYIVKMTSNASAYEFNIISNNANDDFTDYYEYSVDVVEEVYANTATMFTSVNSKVILSEAVTLSYSAGSSVNDLALENVYSGSDISRSEVYLIIGDYVTLEEQEQYTDQRLDRANYIYTYEAILLEGYVLSKPLSEQSAEIRAIVEKYTKDLP